MRVYFSVPSAQESDVEHLYPPIVETLQRLGHEVLTLASDDSNRQSEDEDSPEHDMSLARPIQLIRLANAVIAEATQSSTDIGADIEHACHDGHQQVIALYNPLFAKHDISDRLTDNDKVKVITYHDQIDLEPQLAEALESIEAKQTQPAIA